MIFLMPRNMTDKEATSIFQISHQHSSNRFIIEISPPGGKKSGRFGNC